MPTPKPNGKKEHPSLLPSWTEAATVEIVTLLLLLSGLFYLVIVTQNAIRTGKFIGKSSDVRNTITIEGQGKVRGIPDIATVNLGFSVEKKEVREAQKENAVTMNKIIAALRNLAISSDDMQTTDYSIYPQYDYLKDGGQKLRGYAVTQNVTVKIRDLAKVSDVLDEAGILGLNQVGGIQFTMDEPEALRQQARVKAMRSAQTKAAELARVAGVQLGRVVSFSENASGGYPMPMYAAKAYGGLGVGGGAPDIQAGSQDVVVNATVTYEIE
ncbi:SIMPL domain-containing protein [Candidatus Uhrbacteria bacterium]|nr:SIMPL domain-containing protein [Candidatus Uhrbacteria bacterium]